MKLTCPLSGVSYTVSSGFGSSSAIHPMFQIPTVKLIDNYLPPFLNGNMSVVDTHLLGSALLAKLPIQSWNRPLKSADYLAQFWLQAIQPIAETVARIDQRDLPDLPKFTIGSSNNGLENFWEYLEILKSGIEAVKFSPVDRNTNSHINLLSDNILKIVRSAETKLRSRGKLPHLMAKWAAMSGNFPTELVRLTNGSKITCKLHWQNLIVTAFTENNVHLVLSEDVKRGDIEDLLEWCETKIPYGSLHADILLDKLRTMIQIMDEFKPVIIDDVDIELLIADAKTNQPPMRKLVSPPAIPPKSAPIRNRFRTTAEYLSAKLAWQKAVMDYQTFKLSESGDKTHGL